MGAGGHINYAVRPPAANVLRGRTAALYADGVRIGALHRWEIRGANGDWEGDALRYAINAEYRGGELEVRFRITAPESGGRRAEDDVAIEIVAWGHLVGPFVADGEMRRQMVRLKGTRIEVV